MARSSRLLAAAVAAVVLAPITSVPTLSPLQVAAQSVTTVTPGRILDTRPTGVTVDGQQQATGAFGAGETRTLPVANRGGVPASGVTAVAVNITAINPTATSFVTAFPTGTTRPNASNLNLAAGRTLPNMAIVPLGTGGAISLYNNAGTTHLAVDVAGWYGETGDYTPVAPGRLLDTRPTGVTVDGLQQAAGVFGAAETRTLPIAGRGGVPQFGVAAVALNITAVNPSATSFVTAYPAGTVRPNSSNLNLSAGQTIPNMAIVTLGTNGAIELFNNAGTAHLLVDVMGWFAVGGDYTTVAPGRLLDTRPTGVTIDGQQQAGGVFGAGETRTLPIAGRAGVPASGAAAVAINITAVNPSATSFVTAYPTGTTRPNASNLNLAAGRTLPNLAIVPLGGGGSIDLFNNAGTTHLIVDVVGWFPPDPPPSTSLVSTRANNLAHFGNFTDVKVARNGGFAAFVSSASNLVTGDTNDVDDAFVVNLTTGAIERVSVHDNEAQLASAASDIAISDDGRYVTFTSAAPAVASDANGELDVFRRDLKNDVTVLVSVLDDESQFQFGASGGAVSGDGNVVAFTGETADGFGDPLRHAYVRNISGGTTEIASLNVGSFRTGALGGVSISQDGDKVALVKEVLTVNPDTHIFRYDVSANTLASMTLQEGANAGDGGTGPVLSDSGNSVAYRRGGALYMRLVADGTEVDVVGNATFIGDVEFVGGSTDLLFSTSLALVPGDTNGTFDLYVASTSSLPVTYTRLTTTTGGGQSTGSATLPSMSSDGETLVFATNAADSTPGGVGGATMSLVMKRDTGHTMLSVAAPGESAMGASFGPMITPDGRYVVLRTEASDLAPIDFDPFADLVRIDRLTGERLIVGANMNGGDVTGGSISAAAMSADGNRIAFQTSAPVNATGLDDNGNGQSQIYVRDVLAGTTVGVSQRSVGGVGNNVSYGPAISGNGRFVAFQSWATDLVPNDTNNAPDIFVRDLTSGTLERVSLSDAGAQVAGSVNDVTMAPAISFDGRYVTWTTRSINVVAGQSTVAIRVYRRDRVLATTELVALGLNATMSGDGRLVAFASSDSTLVAGDTNGQIDAFVKDMQTGTITRVSVATGGAQATGGAAALPVISVTGRYVAFQSAATNLVAGDSNGATDMFLHDRVLGTTVRVSVSTAGAQGTATVLSSPGLTASGRFVVFESTAPNLVTGDVNGDSDIFLRDLG